MCFPFAGQQPERLEQAADLVAEIDPLSNQLGPRCDQSPHQLPIQALDRDLATAARTAKLAFAVQPRAASSEP